MRWILGILKKEQKNITRSTMELFLEKTGTDMNQISMELEKLLSYTLGREIITAEDVEAVCTTQTVNQIFEMINAMAQKNQRQGTGSVLRSAGIKRSTYENTISNCQTV